MNKFLALLLFVFLSLSFEAGSANLIRNSSFELSTDRWGASEGGNMDSPMKNNWLVTHTSHSGNFSMSVRQTTTNGQYRSTFPYRLKAGQAYCFSFYARANLTGPNVILEINNCRDARPTSFYGGTNGPTVTFSVANSASWTRYWTNWTTPPIGTANSSNTAYFFLIRPGNLGSPTNEAWMDDFMLEEVANNFTPPSTWEPSSEVETAMLFPDERGANTFLTNETVTLPLITYNASGSSVTVTNVYWVHNYKFDVLTNNEVASTIAAGAFQTNNITMPHRTASHLQSNRLGTFRFTTYVKGYEPTFSENTYSVMLPPIVFSYPPTNGMFGSMMPAEAYWLTNGRRYGLTHFRTLSTGRTNSGVGGQWLRFSAKTGTTVQFTDGSGNPQWRTNLGDQAGMSMVTNQNMVILGVIEWLRDANGGTGGSVPFNSWAVDNSKYTNCLLSNAMRITYAQTLAIRFEPWIKYWELGNEWDTEGRLIHFDSGGSIVPDSGRETAMIMSNAYHTMKAVNPEFILISLNAFTPGSFTQISNYVDPTVWGDRILSSHIYGTGEHGAERLYTNVSVPFNVTSHWQTESGTTCKSEREAYPWEEFHFGAPDGGTKANEGSDPVTRAAEVWKNAVMWLKWPLCKKWFWHHIDEKRSVSDPQSHTIFDWDGASTTRGLAISFMAQLLEGSTGQSNLLNNSLSTTVFGGKFARGTTNCPIIVAWTTNDQTYHRCHVQLATNLWNLYDMFGNQLERTTNINFSYWPIIIEGQAGCASNTLWEGVKFLTTAADTEAPKIVWVEAPTTTNGTGIHLFKVAARDNQTPQHPQGATSGKTNLLRFRWLLSPDESVFSAYDQDPTNRYDPHAFKRYVTNVTSGDKIMHVQVMDQNGLVGSNSWAWTVGEGSPTPPIEQSTNQFIRLKIGDRLVTRP